MSYSILSCVSLRFVALSFNIMHIGVVGLSARIRVSVRNRIHSRLPLLLSTSGHHFGLSGPAPIRSSSSSLLPLTPSLSLSPSPHSFFSSPSLLSSSLSLLLSLSLSPPPFTSTYPLVSPHRFFTHSSSSSPHTPPRLSVFRAGSVPGPGTSAQGLFGGGVERLFLFYLVVFAVFAAVFLAGAFFAGVFFAAFSSAFSVVFASAFTVVLVVAFRVVFFLGSSALFALRV